MHPVPDRLGVALIVRFFRYRFLLERQFNRFAPAAPFITGAMDGCSGC